jgi:hypothetical protein
MIPANALTEFVRELPRPWSFFVLLTPLLLVIALVYKSTKVEDTTAAMRQGFNLFAGILGVMTLIAVGLTMLIRYL